MTCLISRFENLLGLLISGDNQAAVVPSSFRIWLVPCVTSNSPLTRCSFSLKHFLSQSKRYRRTGTPYDSLTSATELEKMFKTTISIPTGSKSESGTCTIELPFDAFNHSADDEENDEQLASFTSKVTASVLKIARETIKSKKTAKRAFEEDENADRPSRPFKAERVNTENDAIVANDASLLDMADHGGMINITVRDVANHEVKFKLKRKTLIERIMIAWANQTDMQLSRMRFIFNCARVSYHDTPESVSHRNTDRDHWLRDCTNTLKLDMRGGDVVDVHAEQTGS